MTEEFLNVFLGPKYLALSRAILFFANTNILQKFFLRDECSLRLEHALRILTRRNFHCLRGLLNEGHEIRRHRETEDRTHRRKGNCMNSVLQLDLRRQTLFIVSFVFSTNIHPTHPICSIQILLIAPNNLGCSVCHPRKSNPPCCVLSV